MPQEQLQHLYTAGVRSVLCTSMESYNRRSGLQRNSSGLICPLSRAPPAQGQVEGPRTPDTNRLDSSGGRHRAAFAKTQKEFYFPPEAVRTRNGSSPKITGPHKMVTHCCTFHFEFAHMQIWNNMYFGNAANLHIQHRYT